MELLEGEREEILNKVNEIVKGYDDNRENLIPILQKVQMGIGYLPLLAQEKIAEALNIPPVDVYGLATFYNQFRLNPPGKHQVQVCMGTACHMIGGQIIMDSFERRLEIEEGETTSDREFSLERVACVGCCAIAPVVVINDFVEGKVSPLRVDGIMLQLQEGKEDSNSLEGEAEDKSPEEKNERGNQE